MTTHQLERPIDSARLSRLMLPLKAWAILLAFLSLAICGALHAGQEVPDLNTSEPVLFRGEIAKGLKIEMALFRDGSSLYGTYIYEAFGRDIQVKGTIKESGEIVLNESVKGKVTGTFQGNFVSKDRLEGKWHRPGSDKGRAFFLVSSPGTVPQQAASSGAAVPMSAKRVTAAAQKPVKESKEPVQAVKQSQPAARADETPKTAPKPAQQAVASPATQQVKLEVAPITRELPPAQPDKKTLSAPSSAAGPVTVPQAPEKAVEPSQVSPKEQVATQLAVVAQEPPKKAVTETQTEPAEKKAARIEGRAIGPTEKKSSAPWKDVFLNIRVGAGFGGIALLGIGLAWVAIVAGGAAGFRDSSALFHKAHALGLSFLPGVFLLALGVGAILAVFVE
jgi:hypothetical protein